MWSTGHIPSPPPSPDLHTHHPALPPALPLPRNALAPAEFHSMALHQQYPWADATAIVSPRAVVPMWGMPVSVPVLVLVTLGRHQHIVAAKQRALDCTLSYIKHAVLESHASASALTARKLEAEMCSTPYFAFFETFKLFVSLPLLLIPLSIFQHIQNIVCLFMKC